MYVIGFNVKCYPMHRGLRVEDMLDKAYGEQKTREKSVLVGLAALQAEWYEG